MINNSTRGQMGKNMRGRDDLDIQKSGLEKAFNVDIDLQGSFRNRNGSLFLGNTKDNKKGWLKEFIFNEEQNYAMEFTDLLIRFWAKGADGFWGLVQKDGADLEVTSPYLEADIPYLKLAQNADVVFIAHENYHPKKLTRTDAVTFTLEDHTLSGTIPDNLDWSDPLNYPGAVMFYEQRLLYSSSKNKPQTVWGSVTGEQNNFTIGTNAGDAFEYTIGSNRRNRIHWITDGSDKAVLGTQGGHFDLTGSSTGTSITPTTVKIRRSTSKGVSNIPPINVNNVILYSLSGDEKIESYEYSLDSDASISVDRSIFCEDLTLSGVTELTYYNGRSDYIIMPTKSGTAVKLVWKPEQSIFAFAETKTDGKFISFCALPQETGSNRLLSVVEREIGGETKHFVEIMSKDYDMPDFNDYYTGTSIKEDKETFKCDLWEAQRQYIHLDCAVTYDGSARGTAASADLTIAYDNTTKIGSITSSTDLFTVNDEGLRIVLKDCNQTYMINTYVSATEVSIEPDFENDEDINSTVSAGDYYITSNEITGLSHLEGKTVRLCKDGAPETEKIVTDGKVYLNEDDRDIQGAVIHAGLPFTALVKTLNLQIQGYSGAGQADRKNIKGCNFRVLNTVAFKAGTAFYNAKNVQFTKVFSDMTYNNADRPPEPKSGYSFSDLSGTTEQDINIVIVKDDPTPMIIQQIIPNVDITT